MASDFFRRKADFRSRPKRLPATPRVFILAGHQAMNEPKAKTVWTAARAAGR